VPVYDYRCPANGRVVEVMHDADRVLRNWGEVCYVAQVLPGDTDPAAPVERIMRAAPAVSVTTSNSELREQGFTKLVKRDDGVYENVTAIEGESRYMLRGRRETMPHLHKKVED
jgi:hypothetical protein